MGILSYNCSGVGGSVPKPFSPHSPCRRLSGHQHLRDMASRFSEVKQTRVWAWTSRGPES